MNWRVEVKASAGSPWRDTGIIESNKPTAIGIWTSMVRILRYHSYRLVPITYGITIDR